MNHLLLAIIFIFAFQPVTPVLTIRPPHGYSVTYSQIVWSPDSTAFAISFSELSYTSPSEALWYVYDVVSRERWLRVHAFIGWFADSERLIARPKPGDLPQVIDLQTGETLATLPTGQRNPRERRYAPSVRW
jgi:hypothetical protein